MPHRTKEEILLPYVGYRRAMGKSWGINPKIAIWMYKTILLPQILYASVVWWPMVSKLEAKNVL
jgi:hypothetical protein